VSSGDSPAWHKDPADEGSANLLRRCRLVAADHPHTTFGTEMQLILQ
jgi:hypothetical protein